MKIATVVRPGGLGDSLLLAPALAELKRAGGPRVRLVGYPERLETLVRAGLAESAVHLDAWLQEWERPDGEIGGKGEESRIVSFISLPPGRPGREAEIFPPFPSEEGSVHAAVHVAQCLGIALPPAPDSPLEGLVQPPAEDAVRQVWVHPGAGGVRKRWPLEGFLAVAGWIERHESANVGFILGESEVDLIPRLSAAGREARRFARPFDIVREWRRGDGFLGNDSGAGHLAALCGLATVSVFGSESRPDLWRPWGGRVRVVGRGGGDRWPSPEEVIEVWKEVGGRCPEPTG